MYEHRPPERLSRVEKIEAWLHVLKSLESELEGEDAGVVDGTPQTPGSTE